LVQRLAFAMKLAAADLALAVTGENNRPELHPVFCLMKTSLHPSLDAYLRSGGRKVAEWMMQQPHAHAHFSDQTAFMNINTPEDLQTFQSSYRP
ncbi:MAG: molybdopterin-guanine dinucleotide biosynthesis protein, partial [Pseudomonadota bacterium]